MTLNQLFWKLTKENLTLHKVNFGAAAKISTIFYQNATYHPMNPDVNVAYQHENTIAQGIPSLFLSVKFILFFNDSY